MKKPSHFYIQEKKTLEKEAFSLKKKSFTLSIFRFAVFLTTCFLIYLTFGKYPDVFIVALLGLLLFVFLIVKHTRLKEKRAINNAKITINHTEIKALKGDFHDLDSGKEFTNSNHYYSNDIDLFGIGSFFQYLNRAVTKEGKIQLANTLTKNQTAKIIAQQNSIKELSKKIRWRQHFSALASLVTTKNAANFATHWIQNYLPNFSKSIALLQVGFSITSIILLGLVSFGIIAFSFIIIWFFIGVFITGRFIKKTQKLYDETEQVREIFKQYHVLLNEIEKAKFSSIILQEKQEIIKTEHKKASVIFKEFSRILDTFDQRNNLLISFIGNGLFLTEIYNACSVEKWIFKYKHTVKEWFDVVAFFDAHNSLANFHFNHPLFIFPEITKNKEIIKATNLGHPLLKKSKRIDNNFIIDKEQFFIITGANMAGKSTFLRTVSLAIVMANCGLPVCAESFKYSPIKLITSMRTTDSLTEDESYFYSELKRLKFIVDTIKTEDYFIILDEILKGTNSKDKAIGSKKFVEKLSNSKSTGIIATHDISLCTLEDELSGIKNYYFDARINADELNFDYTLKNGICKNMNASFLLKKMKII